jgi:mono/diheme cytochrome c family protein
MIKTLTLIFALSAALFSTQDLSAQATWSNGIGEIFFNHCSRCHHDGGIGPFPIMSYQDVAPSAAEMILEVEEGHMPPWPADHTYRHFAFENIVDDNELALLQEWVSSGAPEGDVNNAPVPPVFSDASLLPQLDFTGETGSYASTAVNADAYRTFVIPSGFTTDEFIDGIEILPGNPSIVHHVLIYYDPTNDCLDFDAADAGPGFETNGTGGGLPASVKYMGAWVPGNSAMILPEGFAFLAEAGGYFLVEIHYPEGTDGMVDNTTVNFKFTSDPSPREVYMDPVINHFPPILEAPFLYIPANDTATFYASYNVPIDLTLISTMPHMHLIGQSLYCWGETPNNGDIPLVGIDHWDFHWQYSYMYPSLLHLPDNTNLRAYAFYDNTPNNPHQPNDPPQPVLGGEETDDEMLVVFFVYAQYQNGDENIVVDPSVGVTEQKPNDLSVGVFPNPVSDVLNLNIFATRHGESRILIHDNLGRCVQNELASLHAGNNQLRLNTQLLESGLYHLTMVHRGASTTQRFVVE